MRITRAIALALPALLSARFAAADDTVAAPGAVAATPPLNIIDAYSYRQHHIEWVPLLGEDGMSKTDFYHLVGRDDLTDADHRHYAIAAGAIVAGMVLSGVMIYEISQATQLPNYAGCAGQIAGFESCTSAADMAASTANQTHVMPAVLAGGASLGMLGFAAYEIASAPRMSAAEAHAMAARYNATHFSPYASPDGGGVSVRGAF